MNVNTMFITGNLTKEPSKKEFSNAILYKFSIAYNRNFKNKETGEWESEPHFFNVNHWRRKTSKPLELKKGSKVLIDGSLKQERWQNDAGDNRSRVVINANKVAILAQPNSVCSEDDAPF